MKIPGILVLSFLLGTLAPGSAASEGNGAAWPHFQRILVLPDTSGSLDPVEYATVVSTLGSQLDELAIDLGAHEVGLLPWAGSGDVLKSARRVRLPTRPVIPPTVVQFTEGESIFKGPQALCRERLASLTAARQAAADSSFRGEMQAALEPLRCGLVGSVQGHSTETDVTGALARCSHEPSGTFCLVISDARQEGAAALTRVTEPRVGNYTVVLLVPSRELGADTAASVEARTRWLHEVAPWAQVLPSFALTMAPEEWLLPLLGDEVRPGSPQDLGLRGSR